MLQEQKIKINGHSKMKEKLKKIRDKHGLTRKGLAKYLGIPLTTLNNIEHKNCLPPKAFKEMVKSLDKELDKLPKILAKEFKK